MSVIAPRPNTLKSFLETTVVLPVDIEALGDDEILVQIEATAQDPLDWKYLDPDTHEPAHKTHGRDFSGTVVHVGKSVLKDTGITIGDQVAGFVLACAIYNVTQPGPSFGAQYVRMDATVAWLVPKGTLSHEQAAASRLGRYRYMLGGIPR